MNQRRSQFCCRFRPNLRARTPTGQHVFTQQRRRAPRRIQGLHAPVVRIQESGIQQRRSERYSETGAGRALFSFKGTVGVQQNQITGGDNDTVSVTVECNSPPVEQEHQHAAPTYITPPCQAASGVEWPGYLSARPIQLANGDARHGAVDLPGTRDVFELYWKVTGGDGRLQAGQSAWYRDQVRFEHAFPLLTAATVSLLRRPSSRFNVG